ncbi:MAG: DUF2797 domain-containing protein [Pseudomonadales bacterium]
MKRLGEGPLRKMRARATDVVEYEFVLGDTAIAANPIIGRELTLRFVGTITCIHCGAVTPRSYAQGHCYGCFKKLAACDLCVVSPDRCHYAQGTCREPDWGERNCIRPHLVYLANSSGLKIGLTRDDALPTRWIDQGATQAMLIAQVDTRQQAGFVEKAIGAHVSDRTDWRTMVGRDPAEMDLPGEWARLRELSADAIDAVQARFGERVIRLLDDEPVTHIVYPIERYPRDLRAFNLEKEPLVEGVLLGIKGQYLLLDTGVLNVRRITSFHVELSAGEAGASPRQSELF